MRYRVKNRPCGVTFNPNSKCQNVERISTPSGGLQDHLLTKSTRYITCSHAISFANDMKLAHYLKVNPLTPKLTLIEANIIIDPPSSDVHGSGSSNPNLDICCLWRNASPTQHHKRLHSRCSYALHMPWTKHLLHSLCTMGYNRPF